MINKVMSMEEAISLIQDEDMIAIGGNVLHRAPMAAAREIVRQNKKNLKVVKTAGAHEVDILCAGDSVQSVDAGFISYETEYGLATHYRKAVESGKVKANEHACYTVICALRAGAYGVPFMPVKGLNTGDLIAYNDYFKVVEDPFGTGPITLVKSLNPDVAIIHVQECDKRGNARIYGPKFDDVLMSRASKKIIITTETIVDEYKMNTNSQYVDIPGFMVTAVVHAPNGASPCSCYKKYDIDKISLDNFKKIKSKEELDKYIKHYECRDRKDNYRRGR